MLTEPEAKTKWCPMVRLTVPGSGPVNRVWQRFKAWADGQDKDYIQDQEDNCKCIASECAMWRWVTQIQHGTGASLNREGALMWTEIRGGKETTNPPEWARGFCGLAPLVTR